jgi:hypothetical protein
MEIGIIKTPSLFFKDWGCIAQMIGDQPDLCFNECHKEYAAIGQI